MTTNPGLTDFLEADTGDSSDLIAIYPRDYVLLGGTADKDSWNRHAEPATAERIVSPCTAIEPRLAHAEILGHRIGLRPTRPQIQLDTEHRAGGTCRDPRTRQIPSNPACARSPHGGPPCPRPSAGVPTM